MEAGAAIRFGDTTYTIKLTPLEAAQIATSRYGFFDLDLDVDDRGVKIVATAKDRTLTARGSNLEAAVERMLEILPND